MYDWDDNVVRIIIFQYQRRHWSAITRVWYFHDIFYLSTPFPDTASLRPDLTIYFPGKPFSQIFLSRSTEAGGLYISRSGLPQTAAPSALYWNKSIDKIGSWIRKNLKCLFHEKIFFFIKIYNDFFLFLCCKIYISFSFTLRCLIYVHTTSN